MDINDSKRFLFRYFFPAIFSEQINMEIRIDRKGTGGKLSFGGIYSVLIINENWLI